MDSLDNVREDCIKDEMMRERHWNVSMTGSNKMQPMHRSA